MTEMRPREGRSGEALVEARDLTMRFALRQGTVAKLLGEAGEVRAVDGVSLDVRRGEVLGLVGESGCGKSTLGRLLLRLLEPTSGTVRFEGQDITHLREAELRPLRRRMQFVFQDAHAALNPAMTVGDAVADALRIHGATAVEARTRAAQALEEVGLTPAATFMPRAPAELSGGQQQRVVLARSLALDPSFVVLDEPVSMLDMSVRARVLELLQGLKRKHDLTLLFITHDLATARFLCDRVAIMYLGQIVELGPTRAVFDAPKHPYTRALLDAIPQPDPSRRGVARPLRGEVPDGAHPPAGCRFHPRCPVSEARCGFEPRDLREVAEQHGARLGLPPPERWAEGHQSLRIPGARPEALHRLARHGAPGLAAAMRVDPSGNEATVRFPPAESISLRVVEGQQVRCLLYGDAQHAAHEPR